MKNVNQLLHLQKCKQILELRSTIIRAMREFFWSQDFMEVETPAIVRLPGQEPHLSPMKIVLHNERGEKFQGYLHTSPEYTMKKMLAAGFDRIFSLCKVFRDRESFGGLHNPEFTMVEWYRPNEDFWKLMDDVEHLIHRLVRKSSKIQDTNNSQLPNYRITKLPKFTCATSGANTRM